MKRTLFKFHRFASLALAAFWLVQILTGIALIYARPLDDIALAASGRPVSQAALDRAIARIDDSGWSVREYFVSGGVTGQIDILAERAGAGLRLWRADGSTGTILRITAWEAPWWQLPPARAILVLHKSLWAGPLGRLIVIASALALLPNILLGLKLAWPMGGRWRGALLPASPPNPVARWFSWHRALGLWIMPFALVMTLTGLGLLFLPTLEQLTSSRATLPQQCRVGEPSSRFETARATRQALAEFPGSSVVVVSLPRNGQNCYGFQLRQPSEWRRVFGTTRVYVDARSHKVVGRWDATAAKLPARAVVSLYTIHSGEWGAAVGRAATFLLGLGFLATVLLGLSLWWSRRRARQRSSARRPDAPTAR